MSTSTICDGFSRSSNHMYDRSIPRLEIQNLFAQVMDQLYDLPESAVIEPLEGEARAKYGDYVFLGVSEVCEELRVNNPRLFHELGPIAIAKKVKTVFESRKFEMIKGLFLHNAGILTFRLENCWMAERINNMLTNGIDTWAPKLYDKRGAKAVIIYPRFTWAPKFYDKIADMYRSNCITDVLAAMLLYSGVDVAHGAYDHLALNMAGNQFTEKRGEIVGKRQPETSYFRVEGGSYDFYADLATLWYGVHKQEADLMVYMTPHRLRGHCKQCHVAFTKEGLLPVDWEGTLTFCGFQKISGEHQGISELWSRYRNSPLAPSPERLDQAGYTQGSFFQSACKFTCLKRGRLAECTFKFEDLLFDDIEGNTLGYILKTLLLVRSVISARRMDLSVRRMDISALSTRKERDLGLHLVEFTDAVERACVQLLPDVLCEYLYDLSRLFTRYHSSLTYEVLHPDRNMLCLCTATEAVMDKCCHLLGIHHDRYFDEELLWQLSCGVKEPPKKARLNHHIIPLLEDARNEHLNSRFEIFSMNVRVAHSSFDKGSIYGSVSVLDTYRSKPDGWVSIDKDDDCYVSYFNREWYEPEDINNDSCVSFEDPSCLHSIPFGSSIDVDVLLHATSEEKDQVYLLTNCKGSPPLSGFWSDEDSNLKYGTLRYAGEDGHVLLNYALIKNAIDTKIELKLKHVRGAARAFGDIVAYYGDDILGDRDFLGHYYALIFRADPSQYIGLQEDQTLPLLKSTLAVPINGLLKIKALLTDVNSGEVIVEDSVEFPQCPDGVSIESIQSSIGSFELRVDWVPQLPSGSKAAEVAKTAANSIADLQNELEDSESSKEDKSEISDKDQESEDEDDKKRKAALEKLENASDDTFLGQGLKAIDTSVENFATGAWQAFGNAWKGGGSTFVQKLENSIQQGGIPAAGSDILETGRAFTAKGIEVLEYVGKETVDLLITESGMEVDKNAGEGGHETEEDQLLEEVTFDRCFYIYGGPEQLEELEALSNHYAMLFNRRKANLSTEEKTAYDAKLKEVQQMLNLDTASESEKGNNVENASDSTDDEIKSFHSASVSKAAQMAAGFANALAGLSASDIVQKTGGRLDSLHSEGVHRLSEMCCIAVSQLLILGKSVIQHANKSQDADEDEDIVKIDWPEDSVDKAKTIRMKTQSMTGYLEEVAISFVTGISDVAEAYAAAIKSAAAYSPDVKPQKSVQDKVKSFSEDLRVNRTTAVGKIQDGLHFLTYVVLSTSMPAV